MREGMGREREEGLLWCGGGGGGWVCGRGEEEGRRRIALAPLAVGCFPLVAGGAWCP